MGKKLSVFEPVFLRRFGLSSNQMYFRIFRNRSRAIVFPKRVMPCSVFQRKDTGWFFRTILWHIVELWTLLIQAKLEKSFPHRVASLHHLCIWLFVAEWIHRCNVSMHHKAKRDGWWHGWSDTRGSFENIASWSSSWCSSAWRYRCQQCTVQCCDFRDRAKNTRTVKKHAHLD